MKTPENQKIVEKLRDELFSSVEKKLINEKDKQLVKDAYEFAAKAHEGQTRSSKDPFITHPLIVAKVISEEFQLGANSIAAALLHDVVEDTSVKIEEIELKFNSVVAFLVNAVTKVKKDNYKRSKQLDNFEQMLNSIHFDIRALLIKLADRLHNMRTLSSLKPAKQMKITSETEYFFAPLSNRLGLYDVKSELENLSYKFRSPIEYSALERKINSYKAKTTNQINGIIETIEKKLQLSGIQLEVTSKFRSVYALKRKMENQKKTFNELENIYIINIVFKFDQAFGFSEKAQAFCIYTMLSDIFNERPSSLVNYINNPKQSGYQALHTQFMSKKGDWVEIHIYSEQMGINSKLGCIAGKSQGVEKWIANFKEVLKEVVNDNQKGGFMEDLVDVFYQDDILVFTPKGDGVVLPKGSTALDFAYEISPSLGNLSKFARINGKLSPIITKLKRGDRIEVGKDNSIQPNKMWLDHVVTFKAKKFIKKEIFKNLGTNNCINFDLCKNCCPLPGEEIVGFKTNSQMIEVHKRNCSLAISLASNYGETIKEIDLPVTHLHCYPAMITITAINRNGLLYDLIQVISMELGLSMTLVEIETKFEIVNCTIKLLVPSADVLMLGINRIEDIEGVEVVAKELVSHGN